MPDSPSTSWLLLQLADGTFPSGGFAHSAGLEANMVLGGVFDVEPFFEQALVQAARSTLPFVHAACTDASRLAELDLLFDATLPMQVPNRASRAQGRSLASAASRIFETARVVAVFDHTRVGPAHHAVVFGALFGAVALSAGDAIRAYLHGAARGVLSAAVRLGLVGPLEAQRLQASRAPSFDRAIELASSITLEDVAQTSPLVELWGALHDRLDARLFQS